MLQSVKSEDSERLWYSSGNILYVAQIQYVTDPIFGNESHEITDWVLQKFTDDIESNLQMRNGILSYMSLTPTSTDLASLESDSNTKNFYSFAACPNGEKYSFSMTNSMYDRSCIPCESGFTSKGW